MEIQRFAGDEKDVREIADALFLRYSGIGGSSINHHKMWGRAEEVREALLPFIDLKAVYGSAHPTFFDGQDLMIEGELFHSTALMHIDFSDVLDVFVYALTIGPSRVGSEAIVDQVYEDLWGTAYVDAWRKKLWTLLEEEGKKRAKAGKLSQSFGPGYFGMSVEQMRQIATILPLEDIGLQVNPSGLLIPQKSCAGIVFYVHSDAVLPENACAACPVHTESGCRYCTVRKF